LCPRATGGAGGEAARPGVVVDGAGAGSAATGTGGNPISTVLPRNSTAMRLRARTKAQADVKARAGLGHNAQLTSDASRTLSLADRTAKPSGSSRKPAPR